MPTSPVSTIPPPDATTAMRKNIFVFEYFLISGPLVIKGKTEARSVLSVSVVDSKDAFAGSFKLWLSWELRLDILVIRSVVISDSVVDVTPKNVVFIVDAVDKFTCKVPLGITVVGLPSVIGGKDDMVAKPCNLTTSKR